MYYGVHYMGATANTFGKNIPLKNLTTWRAGGNAEYFAVVRKANELTELLSVPLPGYRRTSYPVTFLGGGSNVLIGDGGIKGLVIRNAMREIGLQHDCVIAESGARLSALSAFFEKNGLGGLAWAHGIPGTIGGACIMNAGAHGGCIADVCMWVEVLRQGRILRLSPQECGFGYRASNFHQSDMILKAAFSHYPEPPAIIAKKREEFTAYRRATQPKGFSAGSVFKAADKAAGYYIDKAGLKNTRIGGAVVSEKHANFILNDRGATANDIATLIEVVKQKVQQTFGITLQEEIIRLGEF